MKIIVSDLCERIEDHDITHSGYLDRQTGKILMTFDDSFCESEQQEVYDQLESDPDRYITIEPIDSRQGFRIMENFVAGLPDGENRKLLQKVLSWKNPFSNFRNALSDMGDIRDQWHDFHNTEILRIAKEWLELEEINAELVGYHT